MNRRLISVVIVSYRVRELLKDCLESLQPGMEGLDSEVWVVDNASGDGSVEMVEKLFPHVRLIANPTNVGFAAANNRALRQCSGHYALLINPDTLLRGGEVGRLAAVLDANPAAAAVGPRLVGPDGQPQQSVWRFPSLRASVLNWSHLDRVLPSTVMGWLGYKSPNYQRLDVPRLVDWASGACLLVRRSAIDAVGLLDESFFLFAEETDWCKRFHEQGWQVWFTPDAEVIHLVGKSSADDDSRWRDLYHRSEYLYFLKHRGRAAARAMWLIRFCFGVLNWARWTLQGWVRSDPSAKSRARRFGSVVASLWRVTNRGTARAREAPHDV